jgi:FkbM family methyltransferase
LIYFYRNLITAITVPRRNQAKYYSQKYVRGNYLPSKDRSFRKWIHLDGSYQLQQCEKAYTVDKSRGQSQDIMIDVGANTGITTRYFAKKYKQVMAFEPSSINRSCIYRNLEPGQNNVLIMPFAVSDKKGSAQLRVSHTSCGANSFLPSEIPTPDQLEDVETIPLDEIDSLIQILGGNHLSLMKIDVQGLEINVLRGAEKLIQKYKPVILCEVSTSNDSLEAEVENFLMPKGYDLIHSIARDKIYCPKQSTTSHARSVS